MESNNGYSHRNYQSLISPRCSQVTVTRWTVAGLSDCCTVADVDVIHKREHTQLVKRLDFLSSINSTTSELRR